ncbi:L-glyceraldehyde 3-phosphate reductase [Pseudoalteromonas sp. P1-9]|uniref:aldo/keto reductase n=1 Tax=Pseudoalteromonas sp. P1-9 TaxID=1710354 RepID=UPI0006D634DE|nr:aldo/keto reductase [Pseudoalteromonas sp. P1-9]KPV94671.1 L-glyceraldehyde 3-phosphate reductase [Pseudoalteromonas sp. P1-9]
MKYAKLGSSNIDVSRICLGTMTWGVQNNQLDANQQIELAAELGINFMDTAEMYAVPPTPETYGKTEEIIGNYFAKNKRKRDDWVVATKIAGNGLPWIRNASDITGQAVINAVDASLKRLQIDTIDVYQLHWPNRTSPHFAKHRPNQISFTNVDTKAHKAQMLDILQGLDHCIKAGKIRHYGLSDDTTWGIHTFIELAKAHNLPRPVSIQNEFNLLHAKDWPYLIEHCVHEKIAYLPWSPLATGMLSGKYLNDARPQGSRWTLIQRNGLFRNTEIAQQAVAEYCQLAAKLGITPSQLALAWCDKVDGVTSTIIGATTQQQLAENIAAFELNLPDDFMAQVDAIWRKYPLPY